MYTDWQAVPGMVKEETEVVCLEKMVLVGRHGERRLQGELEGV